EFRSGLHASKLHLNCGRAILVPAMTEVQFHGFHAFFTRVHGHPPFWSRILSAHPFVHFSSGDDIATTISHPWPVESAGFFLTRRPSRRSLEARTWRPCVHPVIKAHEIQ